MQHDELEARARTLAGSNALAAPLPEVPDPTRPGPGDVFEAPGAEDQPRWWVVLAWSPAAARLAPATLEPLDSSSDVAIFGSLSADCLVLHAGLQTVVRRPQLGEAAERIPALYVLEALAAPPLDASLRTSARAQELAALLPLSRVAGAVLAPTPSIAPNDDLGAAVDDLIQRLIPHHPLFEDISSAGAEVLAGIVIRRWDGDARIVVVEGVTGVTAGAHVHAVSAGGWLVDSRDRTVAVPLRAGHALPRLEVTNGRIELLLADEEDA